MPGDNTPMHRQHRPDWRGGPLRRSLCGKLVPVSVATFQWALVTCARCIERRSERGDGDEG